MKKKIALAIAGLSLAVTLGFGATLYSKANTQSEDCPLKGTPACPQKPACCKTK